MCSSVFLTLFCGGLHRMSWEIFQVNDSFQYVDDESSGDEEVRYYHGDDPGFADVLQASWSARPGLLSWGQGPAPASPVSIPGAAPRVGFGTEEEEPDHDVMDIVRHFADQAQPLSAPLMSQATTVVPDTHCSVGTAPGKPAALLAPTDSDDFLQFFPEWQSGAARTPAPQPKAPAPATASASQLAKKRRRGSQPQRAAPRKRPRTAADAVTDSALAEDIADFSDDEPVRNNERPYSTPQGTWEGLFGALESSSPPAPAHPPGPSIAELPGVAGAGGNGAAVMPPNETVRRLFAWDEPDADLPGAVPLPSHPTGHAAPRARNMIEAFLDGDTDTGGVARAPRRASSAPRLSQPNLIEAFLDGGSQTTFGNNPPARRAAALRGQCATPGPEPSIPSLDCRWNAGPERPGLARDDVEDADELVPSAGAQVVTSEDRGEAGTEGLEGGSAALHLRCLSRRSGVVASRGR